jgi:hypothetical protein
LAEGKLLFFENKLMDLTLEFRRRAEHHNQSAIKYGPKDLRSGALTAIAREEKKQAERYLNDADKTKALQVKDSIDLHGFTIERAVSYVNLCIESIRSMFSELKRHNQLCRSPQLAA